MTRILIELVVGIALLGGVYAWIDHRGAERIEAADARAEAAAKKQADAETALNVEKASKADLGAQHDQQIVDDYRAAHPEQPIRLCVASNVAKLPKAGAPVSSAPSPGAGPTAIPEVPERDPGPDIRSGIDAIVQSAERLAILYRDAQQR